ncbi:MAG: DUF5684 domain-containing protein [Erysipelotrichaceae bacterium]|jgi:hypothetical protein|nr:DUF5684 domain-containing protein [Erysipelotrichaceae bacterium]
MTESASIITNYIIVAVIWYVLQVIGHRSVFAKAGVSRAKAFIPVLREVEMFKLSWNDKKAGLVWLVCAIVGISGILIGSYANVQILGWIGLVAIIAALVLMIRRDSHESKAFRRGGGMTAALIFVNPIANIVIGKSTSEYQGAK